MISKLKKLSTHIKGLDDLFHGGIQVTSVTDIIGSQTAAGNLDIQTINSKTRDSLVIVIRGARGVNKHLFAMQLMHGLAMSIYEDDSVGEVRRRLNDSENAALRYYSINKQTHMLEDMYLDLLIERWISHLNIEYKNLTLDKDALMGPSAWKLNKRTVKILNRLFERSGIKDDPNDNFGKIFEEKSDTEENNEPDDKKMYCVATSLLSNNVIGYNARTNSIHIRTNGHNDDENNFLFKRRFETIGEYYHEGPFKGLEYDPCQYYNFMGEFLNVKFNAHLCGDICKKPQTHSAECTSGGDCITNGSNIYEPVRNAHSARVNFFSILNSIENTLENLSEDALKVSSDGCAPRYPFEVVVIDGFSHISEKDLQSLPYNHLVNCLRNLSRISILLFEDTQKTMPDGDIEIEIRSNYDDAEEYTFNEIRIAKCVNQVASLGWHLYKRQESHIRIYPSLHLNLFKRSYINNQMHELGLSIMNDSYDMQAGSRPNAAPVDLVNSFIGNIKSETSGLLDHLLERAKILAKDAVPTVNERGNEEEDREVLRNILFGKWQNDNGNGSLLHHSHRPVTTIVGNLNSHKRNIALYSAFSTAHEKNNHVLVVLLDKDPLEMRKKILCPGMVSYASSNGSKGDQNTKDSEKKGACRNCYERVSFLNVNSGCIPPEEFLSMLKDQISVYTGSYKDRIKGNNDKKRHLHIIFDDFHRIDFSYPFLSCSNLFTTALISLCEQMNVGLTILCDKDSKRVREVCTLSDYVLCVKREESDTPRSITLYTERNGDDTRNGTIVKYRIPDAMGLMKCNEKPEIELEHVGCERIGSMKGYWRQKYNIFQEADNEDKVNKDNKKEDKDNNDKKRKMANR